MLQIHKRALSEIKSAQQRVKKATEERDKMKEKLKKAQARLAEEKERLRKSQEQLEIGFLAVVWRGGQHQEVAGQRREQLPESIAPGVSCSRRGIGTLFGCAGSKLY